MERKVNTIVISNGTCIVDGTTGQGLIDINDVDVQNLLVKAFDSIPPITFKLTRIKYQKSKQVFSIKDTIHGDDITIKLESDVTDTAQIAVFDGLKAICTSLNTDWDIVQWYEPNILNVDSVEYTIMEMTDENKYIIWMAGEICKSFIVI